MTETENLKIRIVFAENNLKNAAVALYSASELLHKAVRNYIEQFKYLHGLVEQEYISKEALKTMEEIAEFYKHG